MSDTLERLSHAAAERSSLLSVGLEPAPHYLPRGVEPTIQGYERFLREIIEATAGLAAAFKMNVAFFQALGAEGWALMERVRRDVPRETPLIIDGKFGDIGSTAQRYAEAVYERLDADATTVNPLMGRDAAEPWLAYPDRLTFFLVLTSNPGAADFLLADGLYRRIARQLVDWAGDAEASRALGFVVGATRADRIGEVRAIGADVPFLVPGIGPQGGSIEETLAAGRGAGPGEFPGLLFHVTRGLLPGSDEEGTFVDAVRARAGRWRERIASTGEERRDGP